MKVLINFLDSVLNIYGHPWTVVMNCDILPVKSGLLVYAQHGGVSVLPICQSLVNFVHVFRPYCLFVNSISYPTPRIRVGPALGYVDALVNAGLRGEV